MKRLAAVLAAALLVASCMHAPHAEPRTIRPHDPVALSPITLSPHFEDRQVPRHAADRSRPTAAPKVTKPRITFRPKSHPPVQRRAVSRSSVQSGTSVSSTAYCDTSRTSSSRWPRPYYGSVAGPYPGGWPLGTMLHVSNAPPGVPDVVRVTDHIGSGSQLDFALPGDCAAAYRWGRRQITVEVVPS